MSRLSQRTMEEPALVRRIACVAAETASQQEHMTARWAPLAAAGDASAGAALRAGARRSGRTTYAGVHRRRTGDRRARLRNRGPERPSVIDVGWSGSVAIAPPTVFSTLPETGAVEGLGARGALVV
jgi:hypothetical protein